MDITSRIRGIVIRMYVHMYVIKRDVPYLVRLLPYSTGYQLPNQLSRM